MPFAQAFDEAQNRVMLRFITLGWELEDMLSPVGARHRKNIKIIREFGMNIIQQRRRDIEMGQAKNKNDLLTLLMTMQSNSRDNNTPLSDEQLCDYVLNFIIAGKCLTATIKIGMYSFKKFTTQDVIRQLFYCRGPFISWKKILMLKPYCSKK